MPIVTKGQKFLFVRLEMEPEEIPGLLKAHRENWAPPERLEEEAELLCAEGFPDAPSANFAEKVVRWGGGQRFVGRFRQKNSPR